MNLDRAMARAWAEVDEDAFLDNYRLARSLCEEKTKFICVVKANAYGLGLFRAVKTLAEAGADWFAVAAPEEALTARRAAPKAHVLLLSPAEESYLPVLIQQGISLTVGSCQDAKLASDAASALGMPAIIQVKLDTGLHRLGFEDAKSTIPILSMPGLKIEGVYSHLALRSREQSIAQEKLFTGLVDEMESLGFPVPMRHLVDSIGLTRYPQWQMDAVRVGAFLYGNVPPAWERFSEGKQVMALKARITRVAWVKKGEGVGYDDTPLEKDTLVATISAGYIDGYPRVLSQKGFVSIHGKRAPVLGLVCMDQMMVDVTEIPQTQAGDVATLMGNEITLQEYAAWGHLNRNECLGLIGRRVPRIYLRSGQVVTVSAEMEETC
ncbi:MAG: alanine racemase [Clostridiales bacterium]|nr:alanine racemase [Clostridiales bacterium]